MLPLSLTLTLAYLLVNAFGAWALSRRSRALSGLFLSAAASLTVAAVALVLQPSLAAAPMLLGVSLASLASYGHARRFLRQVVLWRHALRAALGVLLVVLALSL